MKNSVTIFWLAILAIIVIGVGASFYVGAKPGKYDTFAQCLTQKGVIFYGAFWCPHCQATKRMFGSSARLLPYHERDAEERIGHQTQKREQKTSPGFIERRPQALQRGRHRFKKRPSTKAGPGARRGTWQTRNQNPRGSAMPGKNLETPALGFGTDA
jgi:thiol-disulfide isomerase/thioredoxin